MHAHPLEARMAHIEGAFDQLNERLGGIERRLDSNEHVVALRFDQIDRRFNRTIGIIVGTWLATIGMQITTIQAVLHR